MAAAKKEIDLTPRQKKILSALIKAVIERGEDISSFDLMKIENFDFSSATLRNEFLILSKRGFLIKTHFASGRIPTIKALRYFIERLMEEKVPDFYEMVELSNRLFKQRFDPQQLLRLAMKELYSMTTAPVFILYNNIVQFYRLSRILQGRKKIQHKLRESYLNGFAKLLDIIEDPELFGSILAREFTQSVRGVGVFSGSKLGWKELESFVFVYTPFRLYPSKDEIGYIGALGYLNLNYPVVVPAVRVIGEMLSNLLRGW